jgi:hypothetical protein
MALWQRALSMIAGMASLYVLWRFPIAGIGAIPLGAACVWLGRSMIRTKLVRNPMSGERDYSFRPPAIALLKAIAAFAVASLWVFGSYAFGTEQLTESLLGVLIINVPIVLLLATSAIYLFAALAKVLFGVRSSNRDQLDA